MKTKVNWFGIAGGTLVLLIVAISLFTPWWQLVAGEDLVKANVSPVYTNFDFMGLAFTIPLLLALNISTMILLIAGGTAMLIYSFKPSASYSERLLNFGYKKPLYSLVIFTIGLFAITLIIGYLFGFSIPLIGSKSVTLPSNLTQGTTVNVPLATSFGFPYVLVIAASTLCIAAKLVHKRIDPAKTALAGKTNLGSANSTIAG
jgi:hypothetical protein